MKDYKQLVAQAVYAAVDGQLSEEAIVEKIEQLCFSGIRVG